MIKSMSTKDAEKLWGISQRRIISLCQQGKIRGVVKNGRAWEIPLDAEKPMDGRFKTGAYAKHSIVRKLPLPIGISDYRLASTEYYYIDKTMLIKDFLDERPIMRQTPIGFVLLNSAIFPIAVRCVKATSVRRAKNRCSLANRNRR